MSIDDEGPITPRAPPQNPGAYGVTDCTPQVSQ
jgi:hypothetical protein